MLSPRDAPTRERRSLNGLWQFALDPQGAGRAEGWWNRRLPDAREVPVPASYNDIFPDAAVRDHVGDAWYQTTVRVPERWAGERIVLRFDSATHRAVVWVNGTQVAEHDGGYTPFEADVTEIIGLGAENRVTAVVDNTLSWQSIPPGFVEETPDGPRQKYFHDFFNYAGLHRSVWLYTTPVSYVEDVTVVTGLEGTTGTVAGAWLMGAHRRALRRVADDAWPLLQGTAAATIAWVIAKYALDHEEPFFAPVAAVIALNATTGERGLNAVRLLQGVVVGIVVGELTLAGLSDEPESLPLATFIAMAIAHALGGARITVAQAAVGAILTVVIGDADAGVQRLLDAFIGAGVALVFSQVLFSPEPVRLLRRAESAALADMGKGLEFTADALEHDDDEQAEEALTTLRELRVSSSVERDRRAPASRGARRCGARSARRSSEKPRTRATSTCLAAAA